MQLTGTTFDTICAYIPAAARPLRVVGAAHDFRNLRQPELLVARILALGRKGQIKIRGNIGRFPAHRALQPAFFENGEHQLFGCAGVSGAFEHDQLVSLQVRGNRKRRLLDVAQIGLAPFVERRGDANQHRVHLPQAREIAGRIEAFSLHVFGNLSG